MSKTVGIIGYGHFGAFIHELGKRFFPECEFKVYSRRAVAGDEQFCSLSDAAQCDIVILCGAIKEFAAQLEEVLTHAKPETIIIDVATVKKHTGELLASQASGRKYLSTHPMFGPESYKKQNQNVTGFRIVVTQSTLPEADYQVVKNIFATLGFVIIEMTADEHDQRLAETLFLTHYVGQTVVKAGFSRTQIDTVSFGFLMDAVESVKADSALFADVFRFNPYCANVAKRLHQAQEEIYTQLEKNP